jgi:glycosidase
MRLPVRTTALLVLLLAASVSSAAPRPQAPRSLSEVSLAVEPGRRYTPSPKDWRNEPIYMAFVDRFARPSGAKPRASNGPWHGGNLKALTGKLDYIKGLGFSTVWINPVVQNAADGYHGYATTNFLGVDPRFGSMEDLQQLVSQAHQRGMRVILDVVVNHTARVFDYQDGDGWVAARQAPKPIQRWTQPLYPRELRRPEFFHRRGNVQDWNIREQAENGDFMGLRDLATDRRDVQNVLIRSVLWWIKQTDADGFRLDTVKHADRSIWPRFDQAVRTYASKLGKDNFLLLGEVYDGRDAKVASYLGRRLGTDARNGRPLGLDSAFNFPAYMRDGDALHGRAPSGALAASLKTNQKWFGPTGLTYLGRFIDNHDVARFLGSSDPKSQLRVALAHNFFAAGIPTMYYGTEQGFRQPRNGPVDPGNRADMFDRFDTRAPLYRYVQELSRVRGSLAPLRFGRQVVRLSDGNGPGLYAFSRIHQGQEVLVVLNTSAQRKSASGISLDARSTPPGTELVDALHPSVHATVGGAPGHPTVSLDVPANGVRVFARRAR